MNIKGLLRVFLACAGWLAQCLMLVGCSSGQSQGIASTPTMTPLPATLVPKPSLASKLTPTSPPPMRMLLPASEIKSLAAEEEKIASQQVEAWNSHDLDAIRNQYTQDIVHYDGSPLFVGIDEVTSMVKDMLFLFPQFAGRLGETYIGREEWVSFWEYWNLLGYTQEHPIIENDILRSRDGRISYWRLFYDINYLVKHGVTVNTKLLKDYATAWSSSDPKAVAAFYSPAAERQDALFGDLAHGRDAIQAYAADFFSWYPNARLELLQPFGEQLSKERGSEANIMQGGVYAIHVTKADGSPCDVRILVLLETSNAGVVSEHVYYNADSLITCGWVSN